MMKVEVISAGGNTTLECPEGSNLLAVLRENNLSPEAPCGGHGKCKKCKVTVNGNELLACQTEVNENMTVILPETTESRVMISGIDTTDADFSPIKPGPLLAYDIGTTTIACYLLDEKSGDDIATAGMLNPQEPYGADVISRIRAALDGKLDEQKKLVQDGLCNLAKEVCDKAGIDPSTIGVVCVVGNPCMQQLFMGINPKNLAAVPFAPVITNISTVKAKDYLPICENAELLIVPDISGYVGADTMGCVISTKMYSAEKMTLMVDIGTNGEMVLGNKDRMLACSTAAGPALEGANIKFGMRGAPGAIDHVWLEDGKICCSVIGDGEATGICGSGLIDAIATMLNAKLLNKRGRILCEEEIDGERIVRLRDGVYITQNDVREVQMAKGAIAAGIELMASQMGFEPDGIEQVLLAGAFGSFMNPVSACRIGLLPSVLDGRITAVGNAAGSGSKMMACSNNEFLRSQQLKEKIEFTELASLPSFQRVFAKNMNFSE